MATILSDYLQHVKEHVQYSYNQNAEIIHKCTVKIYIMVPSYTKVRTVVQACQDSKIITEPL